MSSSGRILESEIYTESGTFHWYFSFFVGIVEPSIYIHIVLQASTECLESCQEEEDLRVLVGSR